MIFSKNLINMTITKMNTLALLTKAGITYTKSEGFWVRIDCRKCQGKQSKTISLNYITSFFECHRCGWKGKSRDLFRVLGVKDNASELEYVEEKPKSLIQDFPESCVEAWRDRRAREYLRSRGITQKQTEYFGFFFCDDGKYRDRLILPVFDYRCNYRTYQGRSIIEDEPKYLNAGGGQLSSLLYGLNWNFHKRQRLWITEGVFDCVHLFPLSVASFSKSISDTQINLLRVSGCKEVVLCWDHDAWKDTPDKWESAVRRLSRFFIVIEVKLPHGDPTNFTRGELLLFSAKAKIL